jgi:hypothetical protein
LYGTGKDPYEYGYRVPFLVISKFVKPGIDSTVRSDAAILQFIEYTFLGGTSGEGGLGTLDNQGGDDLYASIINKTGNNPTPAPMSTDGFSPSALPTCKPQNPDTMPNEPSD